jgi:predicted AAA+ superfamily ATPase
MTKLIKDKLMDSANEAKDLYHSLVLLVGLPDCGKTALLNDAAKELGQSIININLELSQRLLEMTNKKRILKVAEKLDEVLAPYQKCAILDPIEILFDVSLKQDPLALLKRISRNRTIIASWNGTIDNGKLIYSETGHPEYRTYNPTDIQVVSMDIAH